MNYLAVQWLGLGTFIVVAWVQSLVGELRFHKTNGTAKKPQKTTNIVYLTQYIKKLSTEELMLLNCGVEEDSWESLGLQEDQTSQS